MKQRDGIFLVDKPAGMRSRQAVDYIQKRFGQKKIGHGGTLDPIATGLLVMFMGGATKLNQFLIGGQKRYTATVRLGQSTNTYDSEGEVTQERAIPTLTQDDLREVLDNYIGDIQQVPPAYAAVKINGVPAYKKARQGETLELDAREIRIDQIDLVGFDGENIDLDVRCGKGTYIRSLAHDIGEDLGCGGHLTAIRRLQSHPFEVSAAATIDELEDMEYDDFVERIITIPQSLAHFPTVKAEGRLYDALRVGRPITGGDLDPFLKIGFQRGDLVTLTAPDRVAILEARTYSQGRRPSDFYNSPLSYKRIVDCKG